MVVAVFVVAKNERRDCCAVCAVKKNLRGYGAAAVAVAEKKTSGGFLFFFRKGCFVFWGFFVFFNKTGVFFAAMRLRNRGTPVAVVVCVQRKKKVICIVR